ncbi:MAG: hypothetical protein EZS28_018725 [Streblomastix strix]|uniref:DH domain-containing protein n=1 Tax=Streblomastix strix TaxID=222440 RepID=A0A5J4VT43_9EUKA|nr:MAG: hypothetical protein EZS28_018725 [Streblomastix strix]
MADDKKQLSRVNVIREFLETERTYVKCLNQLHQFYLRPIQQHFIQNNASNLDPNLKELISQAGVVLQINGKFLSELESRLGSKVLADTQASDIVLNYAPQFKIYHIYMNIQEDASEAYQKLITQIPKIAEESNRLQKEAKTFVNFDSLSITPIQRVPRYIMLTKEILKHTPLDHQNREGLEKCMESLKETAKFLDEQVQKKIKKKRMFDLSTKIEGMPVCL